jgi:F-type H+-transporting ATPase subunit b
MKELFTDFLTIEPGTIIFTLLNLLILVLFIRHFFFDKINAVLEERQSEVQKAFDDAEKATALAKQLEEEYNQKILKAKEESAEIIKNATKKAQLRSDEIIVEAKNEANSIIKKANSDIEREKKHAINQMKDEITDMAFMIASKVVEKEIDAKDNDKLIEEFINNVGEI